MLDSVDVGFNVPKFLFLPFFENDSSMFEFLSQVVVRPTIRDSLDAVGVVKPTLLKSEG